MQLLQLPSVEFLLTRSSGGLVSYGYNGFYLTENFNSHAHVERDIRCTKRMVVKQISTHTLTWSVTFLQAISPIKYAFQLTRSRGA